MNKLLLTIALVLPQFALAESILPTELGSCVNTVITKIGTRLVDGDGNNIEGSGSMVELGYTDYQMSYDTLSAIEASQVGDQAKVCLVSEPSDCPPGDDRGKMFYTTNLRTGDSWVLSNSQHMCGGA